MPNKFNMPFKAGHGATNGQRGPDRKKVTERTAAWPGLPGKAGPDRSAGVTKVKIHPKSEGI